MRRCVHFIIMLFVLCAFSSSAFAQDTLNIQNFKPHTAPETVFSAEGAQVLPHLGPGAGLIFNYSDKPLILRTKDDQEIGVVDTQLAAHVMAGLGLFGFLQLDVGIPVYLINEGDTSRVFAGGSTFSGIVAGDLGVRLKGKIWSNDMLGVAASVEGGLPVGDSSAFVADAGATVTPSLLMDAKFGPVMVAANAGLKIRGQANLRDLKLGPEAEYRLGAQVFVYKQVLALDAEVFGRYQIAKETDGGLDALGAPLEFLAGAKYSTPFGLNVMAGAGTSIISGYGSPQLRAILGVTYAMPEEKELILIDTDKDGIFDKSDKCINAPEDKDGFEDEDGCPDLDNDDDGITDDKDKCPNEAEDKDGFEDTDGCPDDDNDKDGIKDKDDKCPNKAEDKDGVEDDDGCPDIDTDGDGINDDKDKCPKAPEDKDGFEDADGCPEDDNDKDGIKDKDDKCPNKPGPVAGKGCPLQASGTKVVMTTKTIELQDKIFFDHDKAVVKKQFYPILNATAKLLKKYPQIKLIEIEGHTSKRGEAKYNKLLSQQRANAVRKYLIRRGVSSKRLVAKGYGFGRPLVATETNDSDIAKNRRVELTIKKQDKIVEKKEVPVSK